MYGSENNKITNLMVMSALMKDNEVSRFFFHERINCKKGNINYICLRKKFWILESEDYLFC